MMSNFDPISYDKAEKAEKHSKNVQNQLNQAIKALTAPHSQTTIKLADKSVTPSKTNFMNISTNLIDESKALRDKSINPTTGEPVDNFGGNSLSDWIEVTPDTEYIGYRIMRKAFYTQDRQFISSTTGDGLFTTPSDCYWVRVVVPTGYLGKSAQLNKGNVLLPFESYYEHLKVEHLPYEHLVEHLPDDLPDESIGLEKLTLLSKTNRLILSGGEIDFAFSENMIKFANIRLVYGMENILINQTLDISELPPSSAVQYLLFYDKDTGLLQTRNALSAAGSADIPLSANSIPLAIFRRSDNRVWGLSDYKIDGVSIFKHNLDKYTEDVPDNTVPFVLDTDINKVFNKNRTYPNMLETVSTAKSADIYQMYDQLLSEHPNYITKELLGTESSPDALPLYKYEFKPKNPLNPTNLKVPKIIIATGTHPEKSAVFTLYHTMDNICNHWQDDELLEALRFNFHFIIIPIASPWAYDNNSRTNYNGVDMARNFPARWVQGEPGTPTYGGTAPLSEPEAVILNDLLLENQDAISVVDFHSFQGTVDSYRFLWTPTANSKMSNICIRFIQKMDRKWKKEYPFISQNYDEFIGGVDNLGGGGLPGGSLAAQANSYGIVGSLTYETCDYVRADPNGSRFDSNVMTMGYEAFVNFLLTSSFELTQR